MAHWVLHFSLRYPKDFDETKTHFQRLGFIGVYKKRMEACKIT